MRAGCVALGLLAFLMPAAPSASISQEQSERIAGAAAVLDDIQRSPDKDIPQQLWDKAECVIVIPSLKKAAFVVGGEYGKGLMSCRIDGKWSAPVFMHMEKGSWGLQLGAQTIDLVLIVMNKSGMDKLLSSTVSLGAEASVAVVGHEPQVSELLARLIGSDNAERLTVRKGGAALVDVEGALAEGGALLW